MNGDGSTSRPAESQSLSQWWQKRRRIKKRRLGRMSRRQRIIRRASLIGVWGLGLFALGLSILAILVYKVSSVPAPNEVATNQSAQLLWADGSPMATIGSQNRTIVALNQVPQSVRDAVLAAEDRNFYSEPGISIKGTVRAALNDITGGNRQGGSGITQQYVKNAYTDASPTLSRKLKELAIALKLSRQHSKDEILEYYLNTIYWGRGNTYGIQAASQAYFGVDVDKLTTAQGALLAGIIKAPNNYDPQVDPTAANDRFQYVLDGMVSTGKLDVATRESMQMPQTIPPRSGDTALDGPLGLVKSQALAELPSDVSAGLNTRGLVVTTTIDKSAQDAAQKAVDATLATLSQKQKDEKVIPALVAVNPTSGAVMAYWGNSVGTNQDYAGSPRPPGSSFKPYTLATALQQNLDGQKDRSGKVYNIQSTFNGSYCVTIDATKVCNDPSDKQYSGNTTLAFAMKASLNTTFDGLAYAVGPSNVRNMAIASGIAGERNGKPTLQRQDGSVSFGIGIGDADYSVRPLDQANGFATFANGGVAHDAYFVSKVTDSRGRVVYQHKDSSRKAMDPKVANDVALTLKPVAAWSERSLADGRESGSKTGTAGIEYDAKTMPPDYQGQNSDAWMVGFTPQISAAAWFGTGLTKPLHNASGGTEYGRDVPGLMWKTFMDTYLKGKPKLPLPTKQMVFQGQSQPSATPSDTLSASPSDTSSTASESPTPTISAPSSPIVSLPPTLFPPLPTPSQSSSSSAPPTNSYTPPSPIASTSKVCFPFAC